MSKPNNKIYKADLNNQANSSELSQINYLLISNFIINECTKKYNEQYASFQIPLNYIEFYFEQVSRYFTRFNNYLNLFFDKYESSSSHEKLVSVYARTFSKVASVQNIRKIGEHLVINRKYFPINVSFDDGNDLELRRAFKILNDVTEQIYHNEEERSLKTQYIDFLKEKLHGIKNTGIVLNEKISNISPIRNVLKPPTKKSGTKVSRVVIPKFKLPTLYPISFTKSRVDSLYRARHFISSVKLIDLLANYQITKVKYSDGFIVKRNFLIKSKPKRYTDFF